MTKIFLLLLITLGIAACTPTEEISPTQEAPAAVESIENVESEQSSSQSVRITLTAQETGQTALELLEASATIETQQFGNDAFVSGINGLTSDNEHYWALYVNGEYSQTGASTTVLNAGDEVEYVYESIDPALL